MRKSCFDYSCNYISRYPKTEHELSLQLQKKGYESDEISETLPRLKDLNFLNDLEYARSYILGEIGRRGKPLMIIRKKLFLKGVDKSIISQLEEELVEEIELGTQNKLSKLIAGFQSKGVDENKIIQKLHSRGYLLNDIYNAVKEPLKNTDCE